MNFNKHLSLEGKHAILGASKYHWINDTEEQITKRLCSQYASEVGTILHDVAYNRIRYGFKLNKHDKKSVLLELLKKGIPRTIVDYIDFDIMFLNLMTYVNDCIGFRMQPEVLLWYSDICFGTADAIQYREKEGILRIHDLKTGTTPAHIEQLMIYAALFCLEYRIKPYELETKLRIYQNGEVLCHNPTAEDILPIMDKIVTMNKYILTSIKTEEV